MKTLLICTLALALQACRDTRPDSVPATTSPTETNDARFHMALERIAAEYIDYGRVDDEARWAPWLCRSPRPAAPRMSASRQTETHGRKLYSLFARDRQAYIDVASKPPVEGQVIVKESWYAERVEPDAIQDGTLNLHAPPMKMYATSGGQVYRTGKRGPLFIMYKLAQDTPDTDDGWVYGTLVDGRVTSAGRVASCMSCHADAGTSRLFGLNSAD